MEPIGAILGIVSLVGTIVGLITNHSNNEFIEDTNEDNQEFQRETNLQNHQWALEAAQWEYDHNKPQRQYADLLEAGLTPASAAQKISGANVSYSPATAVAPQNLPKSTNLLNDSLTQVIDEIANYSSMSQAQAASEKTKAETKLISETAIKKANAEIDKILADTMLSYTQNDVAASQTELNEANTQLTNERATTELTSRRAIELSNEEKAIQLDFTRETLRMSIDKTKAEIKFLSEQTAKLQEELDGINFESKYKEWRNTYIETYGVAPEQGWEDTLFKAVIDGKAKPMLDAITESLRQVFEESSYSDDSFRSPYQRWQDKSKRKRQSIRDAKPVNPVNGGTGYYSIGDWYGYGSSW